MQKITPFLWFENQAEEATDFYVSIFKDAKKGISAKGAEGRIMTQTFSLFGQEFIALNGGPMFKFNESISFVVSCENQQEIDFYWKKLSEDGGEESMCGWVKDRFGLWWQVVPAILSQLFTGEPQKAQRAMQAMMGMKKFDIALLQKAYDGEV
ncbi:MAG TPA: VOC family protein [Flavipsychrobacter sp.]|nr:VOC family protein [Flavipsychrobacter sp.]